MDWSSGCIVCIVWIVAGNTGILAVVKFKYKGTILETMKLGARILLRDVGIVAIIATVDDSTNCQWTRTYITKLISSQMILSITIGAVVNFTRSYDQWLLCLIERVEVYPYLSYLKARSCQFHASKCSRCFLASIVCLSFAAFYHLN